METANRRMAVQSMSTLPRYAGGGLIDGLKRAVGLKEDTPEQKAYKERAAAERAAKPAATTLATPPKAITSYSAGTVTTERMKAADAMATGGPIKGPGTGTSDEVPILASNGEYVIRAAAVEEVGTEVLDAINKLGDDKEPGESMEKAEDPDAAMEATEGNYPGESMEEENRPKYATGGIINKFGTEVPNSEEQQRQLAAQTSTYVAGAKANAAARPAAQVIAANPVTPQSIANIPTGGTGSGPTPAKAPATPLPTLQGNTAYDMVARDTVDTAKGAFSGAGNSFSNGNLAEGLGKLSRGGLDTGIAAAKGIMTPGIALAGSLAGGVKNFASGFMGNPTSTPNQIPSTAPVQSSNPGVSSAPVATQYRPAFDSQAANLQRRSSAPNPASGSPDEVMPEGKVNVSMQPNGVKSFSGQNISGQPQYTGSAANTMKSGVMNVVPGMSQSQITKTLTNSDGSQWSSRDNAIMAANIRDGIDPYRGTSQGQANELRALALSPNGTPGKSNAMKMLAMQSEEKRTAGQQQIERDRNAQQSQGTALDNQSKQQILAAQQELANAKTPAEEAAAEKKLRALQGKYGKEAAPVRALVVPGGQALSKDGMTTINQASMIYDPDTKQYIQPPTQGSAGAAPTPKAEYDKLPKGSTYTGTDGKQYTKG